MIWDLHANSLLCDAKRAAGRARLAAESADRSHDSLAAILFACLALEGFVNELQIKCRIKGETEKDQKALDIAGLVEILEDEKTQLMQKLHIIAMFAKSKHLKGSKPFQDAMLLVDIRNTIAHMKPSRMRTPPSIINKLVRKKLIAAERKGRPPEMWLGLVSTPDVADWAVEVACAMAQEMYKTLDLTFSAYDEFAPGRCSKEPKKTRR